MFAHRNIEGEMRSLTISKTPSGKYYASIPAETGKKIPGPVRIEAFTSIGIDVGIKGARSKSWRVYSHVFQGVSERSA